MDRKNRRNILVNEGECEGFKEILSRKETGIQQRIRFDKG
jgi:hypothetical protein